MDMKELLDRKSNLFDHLLYEFEMYLITYFSLCDNDQSNSAFKRNVLIESHAVHLRNLIEFFNCEKNCLTMKSVFVGDHDLSFDDSTMKAKQTISKAIDHLTEERYTWNQTEKDLTIRFNDVIPQMYGIICVRVRECIDLLLNNTDVKQVVQSDLQDESIQFRLHKLDGYGENFEYLAGRCSI